MTVENLFANDLTPPLEAETVVSPEESPSPLAGYVLRELPGDLLAVESGAMTYDTLRDKQAALLEAVAESIDANDDPPAALVTQLDLAFMLSGYIPVHDQEDEASPTAYDVCPPQLLALLDAQTQRYGISNRLDYELIIDVNVAEMARTGHLRTFTVGDVGRAERDFYIGHFIAEPYIGNSAGQMQRVIAEPTSPDNLERLADAATSMRMFHRYMALYHNLTRDQFMDFSRYFATYPPDEQFPTGRRNVSGAFMPSVQLAELALHAPTPMHRVFLDEAMPYFPKYAQPLITISMARSGDGANILDMLEGGRLAMGDEQQAALMKSHLNVLTTNFKGMRRTHARIVGEKVPHIYGETDDGEDVTLVLSDEQLREFGEQDILAAGATRSANFNVEALLIGSTYRMLRAQERVRAFRIPEPTA